MHPYFAVAIAALLATMIRLVALWIVVHAYGGVWVQDVGHRAVAYTFLDGLGLLLFGLVYIFLVRLDGPLPGATNVGTKPQGER